MDEEERDERWVNAGGFDGGATTVDDIGMWVLKNVITGSRRR